MQKFAGCEIDQHYTSEAAVLHGWDVTVYFNDTEKEVGATLSVHVNTWNQAQTLANQLYKSAKLEVGEVPIEEKIRDFASEVAEQVSNDGIDSQLAVAIHTHAVNDEVSALRRIGENRKKYLRKYGA